MTNHYATLNLQKGASEAEIRAAYKKLAMDWHPDRNKGNEKASSRKFVEVKRAHDILLGLEEDSAADHSSTQTRPTGKPFDPFDKAGSPPREHSKHSKHSSSERRRRERRDTSGNHYNDSAYEEPKRRGRANTSYTSYPNASEGPYDTYNGRSRSITQHEHFRKHEQPSHHHRSKRPSYYEEPNYEHREPRDSSHHRAHTPRSPSYQEQAYKYREPRDSSHHRGRTQATPAYHEYNTYEYREPRGSSRFEDRDPRGSSHARTWPSRTPSYHGQGSRHEDTSYTPLRDPSSHDRGQSYERCEPRGRTYYDHAYNDRRTSPSVQAYTSYDDTSSYPRQQYETPSRSPPHYRTRQESISPRRYVYEEPSSFDFGDLRESLYESVDDFHRDAMREHDRVHTRAMRDAERLAPRERVASFLRTFVT